jgi:AcrR family transcriptional regulator
VPSSIWLERSKPASAGLSRETLVRAAVELLDVEGLEHVSMRRVAAELGVTVGALYWYVATKDELLELVLDEVLGEARAPDVPGEWRAALAAHAERMRQVLLRHPWALPLLSRLPNIGPNAVALAEAAIGIAARAGFPDPPAVVGALHDQVVGAVLAQVGLQHARSVAGGTDQLAAYLTATAERHPAAAAAMRAGAADDIAARSDQRFAFSLDCLLDGLAARLPDRVPTNGPFVGT